MFGSLTCEVIECACRYGTRRGSNIDFRSRQAVVDVACYYSSCGILRRGARTANLQRRLAYSVAGRLRKLCDGIYILVPP